MKKTLTDRWHTIAYPKPLFLKVMNILFAFCLTIFQLQAGGAQRDLIVTVTGQNTEVKQILNELEKQTGISFFYVSNEIDVNRKININFLNTSLDVVLRQIFENTNVVYVKRGKQIVLKRLEDLDKLEKKSWMLEKEAVDAMIRQLTASSEYKFLPLAPAQVSVKGKVTGEDNQGLPGVSVVVKGTTIGTTTDVEGNYSLNVPDGQNTLVFSFIGFVTEEVAINNQTTINISLAQDLATLSEVVVVGYGTQRKGDVTSSVASVKEGAFNKGNVTDAGQLIQGKVAGLTIVSPSGDPTSTTQILLRGNTTLLGSSMNPLVLIDGVPGDMRTVAPQDIESIDVLKDGSAAAIYGTRGTNGVILITTRRASGNYKSTVEYNGFASIQSIARKLNLSTAADYREQIEKGYRDPISDLGHSTDWVDEISRRPVSHVHNLTFRGGNAKTNYLVTGNYNSSQGVFLKSFNEAFTGRADVNHNMFNNMLRLNFNILGSSKDLNGFNGYNYRQAIIQNPTAPVRDEEGDWFQELTKFEYENPLSNLHETDALTKDHLTRFNNTITFEPIKGLQFRSLLSYSKWNHTHGRAESKNHISNLRDSRNGVAYLETREIADRLAELTVEYSRSFADHHVKILGGYSYQDHDNRFTSMENWDFASDRFSYHNVGLGDAARDGRIPDAQRSNRSHTNLIGFFGRLNYNYKDKYLLMASVRREAASELYGTKKPWGTFPAISAGWRISNEGFMSGQELFDDIKIRAGYGITGTRPTDLFRGVALLNYSDRVLVDGKWIRTLIPTQNPNADLRWEEKHETNIGFDFSMLGSRVNGTVDYYVRNIEGLLFDYPVPSPPNLYNQTRANVGKMQNKGLEVLLNVIPVRTNDFEWSTTGTFSTNANKLVSLTNDLYKTSSDYFTTGYTGPPVQTFTHIVEVGEELGNFYGFKVVDIGNDPNDEANYGKWIYETNTGERANYSDFDHSFENKKVIGNGLPKYYASWINNFRYKNWDLSITQRGAFKFQVANTQRMMYENPTYSQYNLLQNAFDPVFGKTQLTAPHEFNSYYIEDGDYWKIDNVTLGYNFPSTKIKYIQSARIYVTSLNTAIITGYKGIDPEVSLVTAGTASQSGININSGAGLSPGIDSRDKYPTMRTFTLGLNLTF